MSQSSGLDPGARSFPCREPCSTAPGALVPENAEHWPHAPRLLVHFSLSVLSRPPSALPVLSAAAPNRSLRDSRAQASSWHTRPWLLRSTCDRPRLGSKPMFSAAAGGFFTTEPPGRPASSNIKSECVSFQCMTKSTTKKKKKSERGEKSRGNSEVSQCVLERVSGARVENVLQIRWCRKTSPGPFDLSPEGWMRMPVGKGWARMAPQRAQLPEGLAWASWGWLEHSRSAERASWDTGGAWSISAELFQEGLGAARPHRSSWPGLRES